MKSSLSALIYEMTVVIKQRVVNVVSGGFTRYLNTEMGCQALPYIINYAQGH